jgi:hypothetical protein
MEKLRFFPLLFQTGSCYAAQADLKLAIILPLLPEYGDYGSVLPALQLPTKTLLPKEFQYSTKESLPAVLFL